MRKMKDSGIEWIGEIPEGWKTQRMKWCISTRCVGNWGEEPANNEGDVICLRVADFNYQTLSFQTDCIYTIRNYPKPVIDKLILRKEDILIEKSGGGEKTLVGRAVLFNLDIDALYANFMERLRVCSSVNPRYFLYILSTFYDNRFVLNYIKQTTGIQNLDLTALLANESSPLPSLSEQQRIAEYLDAKCGEIDSAIEKQTQIIEKLHEYKRSLITQVVTKGLNPRAKMKDSGIDWFGEIPEGWRTIKLKYVATIYGRIGYRGYTTSDLVDEGEGAITLSPSNIHNLKTTFEKCSYLSWYKYNESPEIQIHSGDLLFVKTGSTYGKIGLVDTLPVEATINPQLVVFKDIKINTHFLLYFFVTPFIEKQVEETVSGGTIPTMSQERISNFVLFEPPLSEQQQIADYLDDKSSRIDAVIAKKQALIERLTEYKKSLIYEVVTGKREI